MNKKQLITFMMALVLLINLIGKDTFFQQNVWAKSVQKEKVYENDTIEKLYEAIEEVNEDDSITTKEQLKLINNHCIN